MSLAVRKRASIINALEMSSVKRRNRYNSFSTYCSESCKAWQNTEAVQDEWWTTEAVQDEWWNIEAVQDEWWNTENGQEEWYLLQDGPLGVYFISELYWLSLTVAMLSAHACMSDRPAFLMWRCSSSNIGWTPPSTRSISLYISSKSTDMHIDQYATQTFYM